MLLTFKLAFGQKIQLSIIFPKLFPEEVLCTHLPQYLNNSVSNMGGRCRPICLVCGEIAFFLSPSRVWVVPWRSVARSGKARLSTRTRWPATHATCTASSALFPPVSPTESRKCMLLSLWSQCNEFSTSRGVCSLPEFWTKAKCELIAFWPNHIFEALLQHWMPITEIFVSFMTMGSFHFKVS